MNNSESMARKTNRTFILVCLNFAMLFVLFCGLGFLLWQSVSLVSQVKQDLAQAEQAVAELRQRVQAVDPQVVMDRAVQSAAEALRTEFADAVPGVAEMEALAEVPQRLAATEEAIRSISQSLQDLDSDEFAQRVSYHMLKGLGDGFSAAAEGREPDLKLSPE